MRSGPYRLSLKHRRKQMDRYLKSFIIGSSWPVFILFFSSVSNLKDKTYSYDFYSKIAPVYLGLMNVLSGMIAAKWHLTLRQRYLVIGVLSPLIVIIIAFVGRAYVKTPTQWLTYAFLILTTHFLVFNVIVYYLELLTESPQEQKSKMNTRTLTKEENRELDKMVSLIIKRGILAPNCAWWDMSTRELEDASGVKLYYKIKKKYGNTIPLQMMGQPMLLVTDMNMIRVILDNSPVIFGVGTLKRKIFRTFMAHNVGVSQGCPWMQRRTLNVRVLDTDRLHRYAGKYNAYIEQLLKHGPPPTTFDDFLRLAKKITMKIVFGADQISDEIFEIFSVANSMETFSNPDFRIDPEVMKVYTDYLKESIRKPRPGSLVYLAAQLTKDKEELLHQIPHWIFPMGGLIHTTIPRLLLLLHNHPDKLKKLSRQIRTISVHDAQSIHRVKYLRHCVLEMLRLNNPVVTIFRTLLSDYTFPPNKRLKKGDQFVILTNPVLRDPSFFRNPNQFIPERWTTEMEWSYHSLMFSQGPQRCPGKELALFIMESFLVHYLGLYGRDFISEKIDTTHIPQMINPCRITFQAK